jgi:hypothetical protein
VISAEGKGESMLGSEPCTNAGSEPCTNARWRKLTAPNEASAGAVGQASLRVARRARSRM